MGITARDFEFDMPEAIPSGWNTFRIANEGEQEHFILCGRIPDDRTFAEYRSEVFKSFIDVFDRYAAGELNREEASAALGEEVPAWFCEEVEFTGGSGSPRRVGPRRPRSVSSPAPTRWSAT